MRPAVANKKTTQPREGDVYVGRPSKWGNPFQINSNLNRAEAVTRYRLWLADRPHLVRRLAELEPKRLICWCAPLPCHADVLADALEEYYAAR